MRNTLAFLFFAFALSSVTQAGEIYKCMANGQLAYQESPCQKTSQQSIVHVETRPDWAGCYAMDLSSVGPAHEPNRFQVSVKGTDYEVTSGLGTKSPIKMPVLFDASSASELSYVQDAFHQSLTGGLVVKWGLDRSSPKVNKPVGLYTFKDKAGITAYMAYFFFANGPAHKIPCQSIK